MSFGKTSDIRKNNFQVSNFSALKLMIHNSRIVESALFVYFHQHEVVTLHRSALYTTSDFLAVCGGLLGLFLGFSVFSTIKFIYCSILRLYCMYRHFKSRNVVIPMKHNFAIKHISIEMLEAQRS